MKPTWPKTEVELCDAVKPWLAEMGWTVYQEVSFGSGSPAADIVAVRKPLVWVIEAKLSLSLDLLWQGWWWTRWGHYVSLLVPERTNRNSVASMFCRDHGIGILRARHDYILEASYDIREDVSPRLNRNAKADRLLAILTDQHKTFLAAGSPCGGRYSPFKQTCIDLLAAVQRRPGITLKELIESVKTHYHSTSTARSCVAKWIERGKVPGVRSERDGRFLRIYPE